MDTKDTPTVKLISSMGKDLSVVNAARASFYAESEELTSKDEKLIHFLKDNQHDSPFEHCTATFLIECELATAMQIIRHRTFSYNMVSRRYTSEKIEFYVPEIFRKQATNNRQASSGNVEDQEGLLNLFLDHYHACLQKYEEALEKGLCREQARFLLPQGLITKFYMTGNLRNWMHFINLRDKADAQGEVRMVASQVRAQLKELFPVSMEAFDKYFSRHTVIKDLIKKAKQEHKKLCEDEFVPEWKEGYRAALSWLLVSVGEDD